MPDEPTERRSWFRWWTIPAGLGALVVLVIAAGAIVLATRDVSEFKGLLVAEMSKQTGRDFKIDGDFDLSIGFSPALVAEQVSLANAPWGSRPEMATIRRLEVQVALFPMLGGRVETKRLVIEGADVLLETDAQGQSNMPSVGEAKPTRGAEDSELLAVDTLAIRDSLITMRDGQTGTARIVLIEEATGGLDAATNRLNLDATGTLNQLPLTAKASVGRRGPKAPLALEVKAGEATLALEGTIDRPAEFDGLDVAAKLTAPNAAALAALTGGGSLSADAGPVAFEGRLTGGGDLYAFDDFKGSIGETQLAGSLGLNLAEEPAQVTGSLATPAVDLDKLLGTPAAKEASGGRMFSDEIIDFSWLENAAIDLDLIAGSAVYRGTHVADVKAKTAVKQRVATIAPLAAKLLGGTMAGEVRIDASGAVPALALRATLRGIELRDALVLLDVGQSGQGKVDIDADLKAAGASPRALAGSLGGRLDLTMGQGRIDNDLIDLIAADLIQQLMPWQEAQSYTTVNCMVARLPTQRGVMRAETLLLDTTKMTMGGSGTIDLGQERLNLRLVPKPKDPSLFSLAAPVLVQGPMDDPSVAPDAEAVALGVAGSALGTLINPLGILIPFVSGGSGGENPCVAALKNPTKGPAAQSAGKKDDSLLKPLDDAIEGIGGFFD
ncbi:MAG: AsmA family protein [Alphaproteobacteria bacterium]